MSERLNYIGENRSLETSFQILQSMNSEVKKPKNILNTGRKKGNINNRED